MAAAFMSIFMYFSLVLMAESVSHQPSLLNISHAFQLNSDTGSDHNLSRFLLPLFSVPTSKSSSFLISAHPKQPNAASAAVSRAAFSYNDVTLMTEVTMGSPPQRQKMVVDTGSELSWLNCKSGTSFPSFNPILSASYISIPCSSSVCTDQTSDFPVPTSCDEKRLCHFIYSYADGTDIEGNLGSDFITLPALKIPGFVFGCSVSAPMPDTPGLMGLNQGALSLISQLNFTHKFSYCIANPQASPAAAGVLLFGDSPFANALQYTSLLNISLPLPYFNRGAYTVKLQGIKVGDKRLPINESVFLPDHTGAGQTMIDSGTQFTLLLGDAYTPLRNEFVQQNQARVSPMTSNVVYQGALDLCYDFPASASQLPQVTPVTLLFDTAQLTLESQQLLYRVPDGSGAVIPKGRAIYCFTFGNSDLVPVEANIIGNHHQQNLWIEYDLQNSRIGFGRAQCDAN